MSIRKTSLWALVSCLSLSLLSVPAYSAGSVNLTATLGNAPAFTPVSWEVFRLDNNTAVGKANTHAANIELSPGNYRAVAHYGNVRRDRLFTMGSSGQVNVVIAMD